MGSKVFLIDDHQGVLAMMSASIGRDPEFEVCGTAANAKDALEQAPQSGADLVIIDLSLPDASGMDVLAELSRTHPTARCLILSGHFESQLVDRALELGARGYVVKSKAHELINGLRVVASGGIFVSDTGSKRSSNGA